MALSGGKQCMRQWRACAPNLTTSLHDECTRDKAPRSWVLCLRSECRVSTRGPSCWPALCNCAPCFKMPCKSSATTDIRALSPDHLATMPCFALMQVAQRIIAPVHSCCGAENYTHAASDLQAATSVCRGLRAHLHQLWRRDFHSCSRCRSSRGCLRQLRVSLRRVLAEMRFRASHIAEVCMRCSC